MYVQMCTENGKTNDYLISRSRCVKGGQPMPPFLVANQDLKTKIFMKNSKTYHEGKKNSETYVRCLVNFPLT